MRIVSRWVCRLHFGLPSRPWRFAPRPATAVEVEAAIRDLVDWVVVTLKTDEPAEVEFDCRADEVRIRELVGDVWHAAAPVTDRFIEARYGRPKPGVRAAECFWGHFAGLADSSTDEMRVGAGRLPSNWGSAVVLELDATGPARYYPDSLSSSRFVRMIEGWSPPRGYPFIASSNPRATNCARLIPLFFA